MGKLHTNVDAQSIIHRVLNEERGLKTKGDVNAAAADRYFFERGREDSGLPFVGARGCTTQGDVLTAAIRAAEVSKANIPHSQADDPQVGRTGDACGEVPSDCGGDILGFNSLTIAGFPTLAVAARTIVPSVNLFVGSGNADAYKPRELFFEARNPVAGFGVIPSLLISAIIAGDQQLVSGVPANGIPSSVFALTNEPLPVKWRKFANTGNQQLALIFGIYLAAPAQADFFGCMWGDDARRYGNM